MNRFVYNNEFEQNAIINKLSELEMQIEEEERKTEEERDKKKEMELRYAQLIQSLKLSTMYSKRNFY